MGNFEEFVLAQLRDDGVLSQDALDTAARTAPASQMTRTEFLIEEGLVDARTVAIARAVVCECAFLDLSNYDIDFCNSSLLARSAAEKIQAFPLFVLPQKVTVGMVDPLDLSSVDRLRAILKKDVEPVLCEPGELDALIDRAYSLSGSHKVGVEVIEDADDLDSDEPIVAAINQILGQAIEQGASDIHISPDEHELRLRYRIDGSLQERQGPPLGVHSALMQRLKVMAKLDLTQTRRPQDGKFSFTSGSTQVDIRLSLLPTVCGENAVLRVLATTASLKGFKELGFSTSITDRFEELITHPYGMILVTGPTGSGKTTTLYTALSRLNTPDRNVMTIEDPVEIRLPCVRQVQTNAEIEFTFASALRSIMRQDPDVILLGEIRDEETARIAVQAALTGHIVFSTLHTNDAPGAIARLVDFNVPPFAINAALLAVIAQRLAKRVCEACVESYEPDQRVLERLGVEAESGFRHGAGCPGCMNTGNKGRVAVMEMFTVSPAIQAAIDKGEPSDILRRIALAESMEPIWLDALNKARMGLCTVEEVIRLAAGAVDNDRAVMSGSQGDEESDSMRLSA